MTISNGFQADLKNIPTEELVQELASREKIERYVCEPYNFKRRVHVEITDNSIWGITKKIVPTNCDVLLISHDHNKDHHHKNDEK